MDPLQLGHTPRPHHLDEHPMFRTDDLDDGSSARSVGPQSGVQLAAGHPQSGEQGHQSTVIHSHRQAGEPGIVGEAPEGHFVGVVGDPDPTLRHVTTVNRHQRRRLALPGHLGGVSHGDAGARSIGDVADPHRGHIPADGGGDQSRGRAGIEQLGKQGKAGIFEMEVAHHEDANHRPHHRAPPAAWSHLAAGGLRRGSAPWVGGLPYRIAGIRPPRNTDPAPADA